MKQCKTCEQILPLECFSRNKSMKDGRMAECKECNRKRAKENRLKRSLNKQKRTQTNREKQKSPCQYERSRRAREIHATENPVRARYERVGSKDDPCIYCGRPSEGIDHVPPKSLSYVQADGFIYSCCNECNASLGAKPLFTLRDRKAYLTERYADRYANILELPDWSEQELEKMSEYMAQDIRHKIRLRDDLREMIKEMKE